jgi:glycine/serine hydroxymethyltransferase
MLEIAEAINLVLDNIENEEKVAEAKAIAVALCEKYPLPY